MKYQTLYW